MKRHFGGAVVAVMALAWAIALATPAASADNGKQPHGTPTASPAPTESAEAASASPPVSFTLPPAQPSSSATPSPGDWGGSPDLSGVPVVVAGGSPPAPGGGAPSHFTPAPAHFLGSLHAPPIGLIAWALIAVFGFLAVASGMLIRAL